MSKLQKALMNSQGISASEAAVLQDEMINRVFEGEDPEEVLFEEGLEPDYLFDLIG